MFNYIDCCIHLAFYEHHNFNSRSDYHENKKQEFEKNAKKSKKSKQGNQQQTVPTVKVGVSLSWWGDTKGALRFSFLSYNLETYLCVITTLPSSVSCSSLASLACRIPATSPPCFPYHHSCGQSTSFVFSSDLILFWSYHIHYFWSVARFIPLLGHYEGSVHLMLLSHGFRVISNLCAPRENSKMKVEWTLLTAPVCKSRHRVRNVSHIHPGSNLIGAQVAHMFLR